MSDESLVSAITYFRKLDFFASFPSHTPEEILAFLREKARNNPKLEFHDSPLESYQDEVSFLATDSNRIWMRDPTNLMEWENTYVKVFAEWSRISKGVFNPTNVTESWVTSQGPITVSFTLAGRPHVLNPKYLGPAFDMSVLEAVNQLINDSGLQLETVELKDARVAVVALAPNETLQLRTDRHWVFKRTFRCTEKVPWHGAPGDELLAYLNYGGTTLLGRTFSQLAPLLRLAKCDETASSNITLSLNSLLAMPATYGESIQIALNELTLGFESPVESSSFTEGGAPQLVFTEDLKGVPRHVFFPKNFAFYSNRTITAADHIASSFRVSEFGLVRSENILIPRPDFSDPMASHRWIVGLLESACIVGINRLISEFVRVSSFLLTSYPVQSQLVRENCEAVAFTGWDDYVYIDKASYVGRIVPIQYRARMAAEEMLYAMYNSIHATDFSAQLKEAKSLYANELWHVLTSEIPANDLQVAGWEKSNCMEQGEINLSALRDSLDRLTFVAQELA